LGFIFGMVYQRHIVTFPFVFRRNLDGILLWKGEKKRRLELRNTNRAQKCLSVLYYRLKNN
jgi:hypothetical protein